MEAMENDSFYLVPHNETKSFIDNYLQSSRIALETLLAIVAVGTNLAAFVLTKAHHHYHYAYYALFKQLTLANLLAALGSWITNNMLLFFFKTNYTGGWDALCRAMLLLFFASLVHVVFAIVATFQLLGFSVVQLVAISRPFQFNSVFSVCHVRLVLAAVWGVCTAAALVPACQYLTAFGVSTNGSQEKLNYIAKLNTFATNASIVIILLIYVVIVGLCARIYLSIRRLEAVLSAGVHHSHGDVLYERKTFRSIVVLVFTMTIFTIPYCILYLITSSTPHGAELSSNPLVIYYMTLLPYFKIASDPLIYRHGLILLKCNSSGHAGRCAGSCCYLPRARLRRPRAARPLRQATHSPRDRLPTSNKKSVVNYRVTSL